MQFRFSWKKSNEILLDILIYKWIIQTPPVCQMHTQTIDYQFWFKKY